MIQIIPISAFQDNYIWMILHPASLQAVVIDPGDATPVITTLKQQNIQLTGILITHHHWDHTGGVKALLNHTTVPVYGPSSIDLVTDAVNEGDFVTLNTLDCRFQVIDIPGHTLDHIAYVGEGALFCGDTLFTGGCGRVFEGTFKQMYHSLQKLAALPPSTKIYCGHEYTQANLHFAHTIEPDNKDLQDRIIAVSALRADNKPTVPCPLSVELQTNPFLRCEKKPVQSAASRHSGKNHLNPIEVFAEIRSWKDQF